MIQNELKILLLEDNLHDSILVEHELFNLKHAYKFLCVNNKESFLQSLTNYSPDLIISDYQLLNFNGMEALELAKKIKPDAPFLLLTGSINEEIAVECLRAGAWDYVIKDHMIKLVPAIESILRTKHAEQKSIAAEKEVRRALAETEGLYRCVVESISEGLLITDFDDIILFANNSLLEMTGYTADELIGHVGYEIFFDKDQWDETINRNKRRFQNVADEYEVKLRKKNGEYIWVRVKGAPYKNGSGEIIGTIGTIIDITDYKQVLIALEESERRIRTVFEDVRDVIFQTDENGVFVFLNPYWKIISGYTIEETLGKKLIDFIPDDYKKFTLDEFINLIYRKKEFSRFEIRLTTHSGELRWIEINIRLSLDEIGQVAGISGIISDINDRKIIEAELIHAKEKAEESERMKLLFLAQMSHEIRTPLNVILNYNAILKEEIQQGILDEFDDIFQGIENGGKRLMRTIDLILNMSDVQFGRYPVKMEQVNLEKLLTKLMKDFKSLAQEKNLVMILKNECEQPLVNADEYTLSQVFQNLIDNAIKYTEKGSITIRIKENDYSKISIDVIDSGIGVSEEFLPRIFDAFAQEETGYSRKFEGNGLGLSLTKKYIELNSGEITVKSKKGEGTTFTVVLNSLIQKGKEHGIGQIIR